MWCCTKTVAIHYMFVISGFFFCFFVVFLFAALCSLARHLHFKVADCFPTITDSSVRIFHLMVVVSDFPPAVILSFEWYQCVSDLTVAVWRWSAIPSRLDGGSQGRFAAVVCVLPLNANSLSRRFFIFLTFNFQNFLP